MNPTERLERAKAILLLAIQDNRHRLGVEKVWELVDEIEAAERVSELNRAYLTLREFAYEEAEKEGIS